MNLARFSTKNAGQLRIHQIKSILNTYTPKNGIKINYNYTVSDTCELHKLRLVAVLTLISIIGVIKGRLL